MTDTQHTPGPWRVYPGVQHKGEFLIHNGAIDIAVTRWAFGDCNANARLIAAAPDLLAALQALQWAVTGFGDFEAQYPEEFANARAAIAKATGQ